RAKPFRLSALGRKLVTTLTRLPVHFCVPERMVSAGGRWRSSMLAFARAGIFAALVALLSIATSITASAQKAFQRDDLADAAITLEAQIKAESGAITRNLAPLRRDADAAFQRNDFRPGLQLLGQIAVVEPQDSANWLRLAKAVLQIRPGTDRERTTLLERAATTAYIAYQRSSNAGE